MLRLIRNTGFFLARQAGFAGMGLLTALIAIAVVLIVLARAFPILWPMVTSAGGNVTAMNGTDAGTTTFVAFWPVALLVVGIGVAVGLIIFALKSFGLIGGK